MPSNYTGSATTAESPSPAPAVNTAPIVALPVDGDALNAASTYQPWKTLADNTMFIQQVIGANRSALGVVTDNIGGTAITRNAQAGQIYSTNAAGSSRMVVTDKNGLPGGGFCYQLIEDWIGPGSSSITSSGVLAKYPRWYFLTTNAGSFITIGPGNGGSPYYAQSILIAGGATGTSDLFLGDTSTSVSFPITTASASNLTIVLECDVGILATNFATNKYTVGLSSTTTGTPTQGAYFLVNNGNWLCNTDDGSGPTSTDSGITVTKNSYVNTRLRVELHYSDGATNALFFVNEVLAATNTTHLPSAALSPKLGTNLVSGSPGSMYIGQIRMAFNRWSTRTPV